MLTRNARAEDIPRLMEIERHAPTAAHWTERDYNAIFAEVCPRRLALVIELERGDVLASGNLGQQRPEPGVVGFIVARVFDAEWEIENVAVAQIARKRGLGRRLVEALLDLAVAEQAQRVYLEVRESNHPARSLYGSTGFVETGRRKGYYSNPPEDALLLEHMVKNQPQKS